LHAYQRGEVGVELLTLVVVLLQAGDAAAEVSAHAACAGVTVAHQNVQQRGLTCGEKIEKESCFCVRLIIM
jgi:hypothetical protein